MEDLTNTEDVDIIYSNFDIIVHTEEFILQNIHLDGWQHQNILTRIERI